MSDVESGGYTVFMKADAIVKPSKVFHDCIYIFTLYQRLQIYHSIFGISKLFWVFPSLRVFEFLRHLGRGVGKDF